jgi:hypothetical protein
VHRFGSAIELGEAFRAALGLPESEGWNAQQRFASHAQAISQASLAAASSAAAPMGEAQAQKLRTDVMAAYRG